MSLIDGVASSACRPGIRAVASTLKATRRRTRRTRLAPRFMTVIDWAIVALAVVLIPVGYRQGLLVAGLGLGGFAGGAYLGARLAPLLLDDGSSSPYAPAIALLGGVLLGAAVAVIAEGVARSMRARLPAGLLGADSIGGAVAFVALALALAWVAGALALHAPALKGVRADVQRSLILGALNDVLPPSGAVPQRPQPDRSDAAARGPERRRRGPRRGDRRGPRDRRRRRLGGPGPGHRLRAQPVGLGLGRRAGAGGHQRARRSPGRPTRRF